MPSELENGQLRLVPGSCTGASDGITWLVPVLLLERVHKRLYCRPKAHRVWVQATSQPVAAGLQNGLHRDEEVVSSGEGVGQGGSIQSATQPLFAGKWRANSLP